jgi:hypothetical protein
MRRAREQAPASRLLWTTVECMSRATASMEGTVSIVHERVNTRDYGARAAISEIGATDVVCVIGRLVRRTDTVLSDQYALAPARADIPFVPIAFDWKPRAASKGDQEAADWIAQHVDQAVRVYGRAEFAPHVVIRSQPERIRIVADVAHAVAEHELKIDLVVAHHNRFRRPAAPPTTAPAEASPDSVGDSKEAKKPPAKLRDILSQFLIEHAEEVARMTALSELVAALPFEPVKKAPNVALGVILHACEAATREAGPAGITEDQIAAAVLIADKRHTLPAWLARLSISTLVNQFRLFAHPLDKTRYIAAAKRAPDGTE